MTAAAATTGATAALVPFDRLPASERDSALRPLATELLRRSAPDDTLARLAHRLRRADDGSLFIELDIPRLPGWPSGEYIGSAGAGGDPWALKILCDLHTDPAEAFYLASKPKILPLAEAVALVLSPDDPLADLARRRAEVEARRAEGTKAANEAREEQRRKEAADRGWEAANRPRVQQWKELPQIWQELALAADESGDPRLQAFVAKAIKCSASRNFRPHPPSWLWPLAT